MVVDPFTYVGRALDAAAHGRWSLAGVLALIVIVALGRKFLAPKIPALLHDFGAMAFTFLISALVSAAALLGDGTVPLTWKLANMALVAGVSAAGGYAAIKKFAWPLAMYLLSRWAIKIPVLGKVLAGLSFRLDAEGAFAKATRAGSAAVVAMPSAGLPKGREVE